MFRKSDEKLEWLKRALPLDGLTDNEVQALGATSDRISFEQGHVLARQRQP